MPFINDPQGRQEVEKVSRRLKLPVWKSICKGEFRKWWNEWWDKIDTFAEAIEAIKIEAGTGLEGGGNLTENRTLSLKEATKTELGGIIIGENLTYNPTTGAVDGNPTYTHPTTEGNKHIPAGGAAGNLLLWKSPGTGEWGKAKYADITGTPVSLKNPYSLTINVNGVSQGGYDGSVAKTIEISSVSADHTHDDRYYTEAEIEEKFKNFCPFPVNSIFLSLDNSNPATIWLGTTWQKQEGRFLLGSNSSYPLGSTGGSSTTTLSKANLPAHNHSATQSAHAHTQPTHTHVITSYEGGGRPGVSNYNAGWNAVGTQATSSAGGENTGSAQPTITIGNTGSGTPFNNMPPYLVVNIWKRLT